MPKRRKGREEDVDASQEVPTVRLEDSDGDFEADDEVLDSDDNLFDSGVTDTSEFATDESGEFEDELDDDDIRCAGAGRDGR